MVYFGSIIAMTDIANFEYLFFALKDILNL